MLAKYLVFIFIFVVHISAKDANVSTNICKDYLDPDLRREMLVKMPKDKKVVIDINNDGAEEKVLLKVSAGRDISYTDLYIYDQDNTSISHKIDSYEDVRFARRMQILFYKEHYYMVYYYDAYEKFPTHITYVNSKNIEYPLCKYKSKKTLKLDYHDKAYTPALCDGLLKHVKEKKFISFNIPSKFKFNPTKEQHYNSSVIFIRGIGYLDYNNDGKKEYLQFFENRYNGTKNFYRVLAEDKKTFDTNQTEHMTEANWFKANDKIYSVYSDIDGKISIEIREKNSLNNICIYMEEPENTILKRQYKK